MSITLDAISSKVAGNTSSSSNAHTCASSNTVLIVGVQADSGVDPTGVTYNGVAMTKAISLNAGIHTSLWYLASPASGAHDIAVTFAAGHYFNFFGISLNGCDTSSPIDGTASASGSTNDAKTSQSLSILGGWRVLSGAHNRNSSVAAIAGSTVQTNVHEPTDNFSGIGVSNSSGSTGAADVGWTMGTPSDGWYAVSIGVAPLAQRITQSETSVSSDAVTKSLSRSIIETSLSLDSLSKALSRAMIETSTSIDLTPTVSRIISLAPTTEISVSTDTPDATSLWNRRTKPSSSWSVRSTPTTSWVDRTPPITPWT